MSSTTLKALRVVGGVLGGGLTIIGVAGVPDDYQQWRDWLGALDGDAVRTGLVIAGILAMLLTLIGPHLYDLAFGSVFRIRGISARPVTTGRPAEPTAMIGVQNVGHRPLQQCRVRAVEILPIVNDTVHPRDDLSQLPESFDWMSDRESVDRPDKHLMELPAKSAEECVAFAVSRDWGLQPVIAMLYHNRVARGLSYGHQPGDGGFFVRVRVECAEGRAYSTDACFRMCMTDGFVTLEPWRRAPSQWGRRWRAIKRQWEIMWALV